MERVSACIALVSGGHRQLFIPSVVATAVRMLRTSWMMLFQVCFDIVMIV